MDHTRLHNRDNFLESLELFESDLDQDDPLFASQNSRPGCVIL